MIWKPRETSIFPSLPRVPLFFSYDRAVYIRNAYGPKTIGGVTAYGKQDTCDANKVPLFSSYDRAVQVRTAYGPKAIGDATAYGK